MPETLRNITTIMASKEDSDYKALGGVRRSTAPMVPASGTEVVGGVKSGESQRSMEAVERIWYNGRAGGMHIMMIAAIIV